jgi:sulfur carrier protein
MGRASANRNAKDTSMQLIVNGQDREFASPQTVASLLEAMGYGGRRVAVEVNREIVPRSRHPLQALADGDRIEIIHAMGGG